MYCSVTNSRRRLRTKYRHNLYRVLSRIDNFLPSVLDLIINHAITWYILPKNINGRDPTSKCIPSEPLKLFFLHLTPLFLSFPDTDISDTDIGIYINMIPKTTKKVNKIPKV